MKRTLVVALFVACKLERNAAPTAVDAAAIPIPSARAAASGSARSARPDPFAEPRFVLVKWNAAHGSHDVHALEALYAPTVRYYGQTLSGAACAKGKAAAFAKSPDYAQTVRDASFTKQDSSWLVSFTKTSTSGGKSTDYPAFLVVEHGRIAEESDKITDANLAKLRAAHAASDWCHDARGRPNDVVKPPFTPSDCPKPCKDDPGACVVFRVYDPSRLAIRSDGTVLNDATWLEDMYVDFVTKKAAWQTNYDWDYDELSIAASP